MILLHVLIPGIVGHPAWPHATSPQGSGRCHTVLDMDVDGEQALHDLEEDIIIMQDTNKDTTHNDLEDEMDDVVNRSMRKLMGCWAPWTQNVRRRPCSS